MIITSLRGRMNLSSALALRPLPPSQIVSLSDIPSEWMVHRPMAFHFFLWRCVEPASEIPNVIWSKKRFSWLAMEYKL